VKNSTKAGIQVTAGIISILVGITIYLLWRSSGLLVFHVLQWVGLMDALAPIRASMIDYTPCRFVLYCLPDGLWATAYILLIDSVFKEHSIIQRIVWAGIIPLTGALSEVLQWFALLPGTFDIGDLLCYLTPMLVYIIILTTYARKHYTTNATETESLHQ